jgi:hypothetical protein
MFLPPIAIMWLSSHCCCPITIIQSPSLNCGCCVIDIVAVGRRGGGIIAITVAVAVAISTIAIVVIILKVALSTLLCQRCRNGGGASFLGTYLTYSYVENFAGLLVVCGNKCFW